MVTLPQLTELEASVAAVAVVVAGYFLSGEAGRRLRKQGEPPHAVRFARVMISAVSVLVAVAVLVAFFGPISFLSGLTVSAVVGIAVTLALQTTLANVIAGFILLRNRMIRINDRVTIGGITGQIVQLGIVTIWLRMPDGSVAFVSNSTLLAGPLVNRSAAQRLEGEF